MQKPQTMEMQRLRPASEGAPARQPEMPEDPDAIELAPIQEATSQHDSSATETALIATTSNAHQPTAKLDVRHALLTEEKCDHHLQNKTTCCQHIAEKPSGLLYIASAIIMGGVTELLLAPRITVNENNDIPNGLFLGGCRFLYMVLFLYPSLYYSADGIRNVCGRNMKKECMQGYAEDPDASYNQIIAYDRKKKIYAVIGAAIISGILATGSVTLPDILSLLDS